MWTHRQSCEGQLHVGPTLFLGKGWEGGYQNFHSPYAALIRSAIKCVRECLLSDSRIIKIALAGSEIIFSSVLPRQPEVH